MCVAVRLIKSAVVVKEELLIFFVIFLWNTTIVVFFGLMGSAQDALYFSRDFRPFCRPLSVGVSSKGSSAYSKDFTSMSCGVSPGAKEDSGIAARSLMYKLKRVGLGLKPVCILGPAGSPQFFSIDFSMFWKEVGGLSDAACESPSSA